jgi:hypothetical protein
MFQLTIMYLFMIIRFTVVVILNYRIQSSKHTKLIRAKQEFLNYFQLH